MIGQITTIGAIRTTTTGGITETLIKSIIISVAGIVLTTIATIILTTTTTKTGGSFTVPVSKLRDFYGLSVFLSKIS